MNLPFNGELSVQVLREAIKATEGVKDLPELSVQSKWIELESVTGYTSRLRSAESRNQEGLKLKTGAELHT